MWLRNDSWINLFLHCQKYFCCCLTSKLWVFGFNRFLQETVTGTLLSNMTSPRHSTLSMFVFTPNSGTVGSLWELRFMAVMVRAMLLEPYLSFILVKTVFAYQKKKKAFPAHVHFKLFSKWKPGVGCKCFLHIIRVHSTLTELPVALILLTNES